jgi:hypothetical protein
MKNKNYIWISVAILAVGGYFVYNEYKKPKQRTKEENVKIIVENGKNENPEFISTFEFDFLNLWANSILQEKNSFLYKGKEYNTQGGTSVKK